MKRVLIFGGTRGLGAELTRLWRDRGHEVVAVGKEQCDLADKTELAKFLLSLQGDFQVVIYCAGCSAGGKVLDVPVEEVEKCYEVGFFSPLAIFRYFLGRATIPESFIVVLSGTAEFFLPGLFSYSLPKRALRDLVAYLKMEYPRHAGRFILVYPGGMKTGFDENTPLFGGYRLARNTQLKDPVHVARAIVSRVDRGKGGTVGVPWLLRGLGMLQAILPRPLNALAAWILSR